MCSGDKNKMFSASTPDVYIDYQMIGNQSQVYTYEVMCILSRASGCWFDSLSRNPLVLWHLPGITTSFWLFLCQDIFILCTNKHSSCRLLVYQEDEWKEIVCECSAILCWLYLRQLAYEHDNSMCTCMCWFSWLMYESFFSK